MRQRSVKRAKILGEVHLIHTHTHPKFRWFVSVCLVMPWVPSSTIKAKKNLVIVDSIQK